MKTLLVLNRKLCCSKWGKKVGYFFLLFSLSQVFICWGNKTQCSPKGNSADLPMVADNRNFRCLRSAWVTEVCNVKLIIRIKDSWLVMRARKNNYMIIIECIEIGTEITTTEWLRINLISCSKGMEKSGKGYPVPRWNYSEVIGHKIFAETTNHRLLVNLLSKSPWPSTRALAAKLHSRIWNFILILLFLKRKNKHVRNWTRCILLLEAQECWLTITRNFHSMISLPPSSLPQGLLTPALQ